MLQLSESVRTTIDHDGAVVLDVAQGKIIRLNRTGASLLELLSQGSQEQALASALSRLCEIPLDRAAADVSEFLASLEAHGLLRRNGSARGK